MITGKIFVTFAKFADFWRAFFAFLLYKSELSLNLLLFILAIFDCVFLRQLAMVIKFVFLAIFAISSIHLCKQFPLNDF